MGDPDTTERRREIEIRKVFVEAYEVLEPFFAPENQWAGHNHEHLAYMALRERFPHLDPRQLQILIEAARRVFADGNRPAP